MKVLVFAAGSYDQNFQIDIVVQVAHPFQLKEKTPQTLFYALKRNLTNRALINISGPEKVRLVVPGMLLRVSAGDEPAGGAVSAFDFHCLVT